MAEKNNANIGFEKQIWDAACVLWGHIPAAEYRKVIVGLIFLRYISAGSSKAGEILTILSISPEKKAIITDIRIPVSALNISPSCLA